MLGHNSHWAHPFTLFSAQLSKFTGGGANSEGPAVISLSRLSFTIGCQDCFFLSINASVCPFLATKPAFFRVQFRSAEHVKGACRVETGRTHTTRVTVRLPRTQFWIRVEIFLRKEFQPNLAVVHVSTRLGCHGNQYQDRGRHENALHQNKA